MLKFIKRFLIISLVQFILFVIIAGVAIYFLSKPPKVEDNSVLELTIKGDLPEHLPTNYLETLLGEKKLTLSRILETIETAQKDDRISGIYLKLGGLNCGWAKIEELRDKLAQFRKSGKWIVVYLISGSEKEYYLALAADEIYLCPTGDLYLDGLQARVSFIKGTLNKIGIQPEVERVGKYKSAADTFNRETMSDAQREVLNSILDEFYERFTAAVADRRHVDVNDVLGLINEDGFIDAEEAIELDLIDGSQYEDEVNARLREKNNDEESLTSIKLKKYTLATASPVDDFVPGKKIALIYGMGAITTGSDDYDPLMGRILGADDAISLIRKARDDKDVKAVIYRVNSPGGSGLASDLIWRELMITKEKKPVIVSMSDVAASGGYYISMCADSIIAQPNTLTGSIGVLAVKMNMEELYEEKLGMTVESIQRGKYAAIFDESKPMSAEERAKFREMVMDFYKIFVQKAADNRGLSYAELDAVAQGRVWTGQQAYDAGLVDALGGVDRAILAAKRKLGMKDDDPIHVVTLTKEPNLLTEILREVEVQGSPSAQLVESAAIPDAAGLFQSALVWRLAQDHPVMLFPPYLVHIE
ncbi:MAG: signal peptide peptidase SppA [Gemmatimonadetes bacterium]|nr:MAG: signal peptide peptidase SppA [Gemmatimonadota bacterium]